MSTAGRHSKDKALISYRGPKTQKAELEKIALERYPDSPGPLSEMLREIHRKFIAAHYAQAGQSPHTPTPADVQQMKSVVSKAHDTATRNRKAVTKR